MNFVESIVSDQDKLNENGATNILLVINSNEKFTDKIIKQNIGSNKCDTERIYFHIYEEIYQQIAMNRNESFCVQEVKSWCLKGIRTF